VRFPPKGTRTRDERRRCGKEIRIAHFVLGSRSIDAHPLGGPARPRLSGGPGFPATWSLSTLRRALRGAPHGLPEVSTYTIWKVLRETGFDWQRTSSWCETGRVKRKRKRKSGEVVEVTDPDAEAKKI
jgi:hypothetical protein